MHYDSTFENYKPLFVWFETKKEYFNNKNAIIGMLFSIHIFLQVHVNFKNFDKGRFPQGILNMKQHLFP